MGELIKVRHMRANLDLYDEDEVWFPRKLRRLKLENGKGGAGHGTERDRVATTQILSTGAEKS